MEISNSEWISIFASIVALAALLISFLSYRYAQRIDKIKFDREEEGKREAVKPIFRIARQEPSVAELNFYDKHERNPEPINSIRYLGKEKFKYVDVVLENVTKARPFNIRIKIPKDIPFIVKPLSGATKRDSTNNLIINTVIKDNLIVKDHINNFKLILKFSDIENNEYKQVITCYNYILEITEPKLIERG